MPLSNRHTDRRRRQTQGRLSLPDGRGPVHRRRRLAAAELRRVPALAARARENPQHRYRPPRKQSPGVIAMFTGADLAGDNVGGLPCGWLIHSTDGKPMNEPPHPVIAHDKVRARGRSGGARRRGIGEGSEGRARTDRRRLRRAARRRRYRAAQRMPASRSCTTACRTTSATTGATATRRRPTPRSRRPRTSRRSTS